MDSQLNNPEAIWGGFTSFGRGRQLPIDIRCARVELARRAETLVLVRSAFAVALFSWVLWVWIPTGVLAVWLLCAVVVLAARTAAARHVQRSSEGVRGFVEREEHHARIKEIATGSLWVGLAFLCVIHAPQRLEFPYIIFVLLTIQIFMGVPLERGSAVELFGAVAAAAAPLVLLMLSEAAPPHAAMFGLAMVYAVSACIVGCRLQIRSLREGSRRSRGLELLAELSRRTEILREAALSKTRFIATFVHELRQPLQAAMLLSEALGWRLRGMAPAAIAEATTKSARSMADAVTSVLEISRFEAGSLRPQVRRTALQPILEALRRQYVDQARREGTCIEVVPTSAFADTDPELLSRILDRFMQNALAFARGGRIAIGCRRRADSVRIHVVDTGCGIAKHLLTDVFNEFCHARAPELHKAEGAGLGLAVAKRIAVALGHRVGVSAVRGKGSSFYVEIPCVARSRACQEEPRASALPRRVQIETVDSGFIMNGFGAFIGAFGTLIIAGLVADKLESAQLATWLGYAMACYTVRLLAGFLYFRYSRTRHRSVAVRIGQGALVYMIIVTNNTLAVLGIFLALGPADMVHMCYLLFLWGFVRNGNPRWFVTQMLNSESVYREPNRYLVPLLLHAGIPLLVVVVAQPRLDYAIAGALALAYVVATIMLEPAIRAKIVGSEAARFKKLDLINSIGALRGGLETAQRELAIQQSTLNCANTARRHFVDAASHDFRQPAQAIAMNVAGLRARVTDPEALQLLDQLDACVAAIRRQFDALAEVWDADATPGARLRDIAADEVLVRLRAQFAPQARAADARLSISECTRVIRTDPLLLERILGNLISNALRHGAGRRVVVGCRRRGQHVVFQVIDAGPGIPVARIGEMFREFHQLAQDGSSRSPGVGLGLAIVERAVNRLGHRLSVTSSVGGGTMFSLDVPVGKYAPAPAGPVSGRQSVARFDGLRVLVIDDDSMCIEALARVLEDWGMGVLRAASASMAERVMNESGETPHIIIADHHLRGEATGVQAIHRLREQKGAIPALVLSGGMPPEAVHEAHRLGCPILAKPISCLELNVAMRGLLKSTMPLAARVQAA